MIAILLLFTISKKFCFYKSLMAPWCRSLVKHFQPHNSLRMLRIQGLTICNCHIGVKRHYEVAFDCIRDTQDGFATHIFSIICILGVKIGFGQLNLP
jgi:hypothetical protein